MALRLRDINRTPEPPPPAPEVELNKKLDAVLEKLAADKSDESLVASVDALRQEIAALRASKANPWTFDVKRDANGKITEVVAKQGREAVLQK